MELSHYKACQAVLPVSLANRFEMNHFSPRSLWHTRYMPASVQLTQRCTWAGRALLLHTLSTGPVYVPHVLTAAAELFSADQSEWLSGKERKSKFQKLIKLCIHVQSCSKVSGVGVQKFSESLHLFSRAVDKQVKWNGSHQVDEEPTFKVVHSNAAGLADHLIVGIDISCAKVNDNINNKHYIYNEIHHIERTAGVSTALPGSLLLIT